MTQCDTEGTCPPTDTQQPTRFLFTVRKRHWTGLMLLFVSICIGTPSHAQESRLQGALTQVANESTLEITTIGRKSGKPRTTPIWFVYDQGALYIQSGKDGKTHWYRNLQKNPQMQLKIGQLTLTGKAQFVTDTAESEKVHDLFRSKYALARAAGFVGSSIGHGEVILVEHLTEAAPPE